MGTESRKELLCIAADKKNFALEFDYIKEICQEAEISVMPCFPSYFCGVYNYKGQIIPAAVLGEEAEPYGCGGSHVLLIVSCGKYQFGIVFSKDAELLLAEDPEWMESPVENGGRGVWKEKAVIRCEERLFSLIDVERTVESMIHEK